MDLEGFIWTNPLKKLYEDKKGISCNPFYNIYLDCEEHLNYLVIIWDRLKEDYRNFTRHSDFHDKVRERAIPGTEYHLSPEEIQESYNLTHSEFVLMLDYESFIIFARMMDKLAKVAACIINRGVNLIPTGSFTDHKEYFLKGKNKPFPLNEKYARVIREETEWYELSLTAIRDKIITHGNARMRSIPSWARDVRNSRPYTRPIKMVKLSSFSKQNDKIIEIKKRYESEYPDLKKIFNLWEVLDYFLANNVKLSRQDKSEVVQIINSTGATLPDLRILADNIKKFLHEFCQALK